MSFSEERSRNTPSLSTDLCQIADWGTSLCETFRVRVSSNVDLCVPDTEAERRDLGQLVDSLYSVSGPRFLQFDTEAISGLCSDSAGLLTLIRDFSWRRRVAVFFGFGLIPAWMVGERRGVELTPPAASPTPPARRASGFQESAFVSTPLTEDSLE